MSHDGSVLDSPSKPGDQEEVRIPFGRWVDQALIFVFEQRCFWGALEVSSRLKQISNNELLLRRKCGSVAGCWSVRGLHCQLGAGLAFSASLDAASSPHLSFPACFQSPLQPSLNTCLVTLPTPHILQFSFPIRALPWMPLQPFYKKCKCKENWLFLSFFF